MMRREYADARADATYDLGGVQRRLRVVDNPELRLRECRRLEARAKELLDLAQTRRDELIAETARRVELLRRQHELVLLIWHIDRLDRHNAIVPLGPIRSWLRKQVSQMEF